MQHDDRRGGGDHVDTAARASHSRPNKPGIEA
jgi:hypothetical protein